MFESFGNRTCNDKNGKTRSVNHGAAVMASNLYVGLVDMSRRLLEQCGFAPEDAAGALSPLILGNVRHIVRDGTENALTGPVERMMFPP